MKSLLSFFTVCFLSLTLLACAKIKAVDGDNVEDPSQPDGTLFEEKDDDIISKPSALIGLWESEPYTNGGIRKTIRIRLDAKKVTSSSRCNFPDGVTTYAQTSGEAKYNELTLEILEDKESTTELKKDNASYKCKAMIKEDKLSNTEIFSGKLWIDNLIFTKIAN